MRPGRVETIETVWHDARHMSENRPASFFGVVLDAGAVGGFLRL
jgi:hypothetical protein